MPYAIIRTGGKQYRVKAGDRLRVEKLEAEVGQEVALDDVLAVGEGAELTFASGALAGKAVQVKIIHHGRGRKIHILKFKRRKGEQTVQGHRQDFTEIEIISLPSAF